MKNQSSHSARKDRSPENINTSFSVSRKLLAEAKEIAIEEKRPLSNLIAKLLEDEIARRRAERMRSVNK